MTAINNADNPTEPDSVLAVIWQKVLPAILDICAKKESGEIVIRFQSGEFRQAVRREVTL